MFLSNLMLSIFYLLLYLKFFEAYFLPNSIYFKVILLLMIFTLFYKKKLSNIFFLGFNLLISLYIVVANFPYTANHYFLMFYFCLGFFLSKLFKEDYKKSIRYILGTIFLFAGINKTININYVSGSYVSQSVLSQRLYDKVIPDEYALIKDKEIEELYRKGEVRVSVPTDIKILLFLLAIGSLLYQYLMAFVLIFDKKKYFDILFILHCLVTVLGTTEYIFGSILSITFYLLSKKKIYVLFLVVLLLMEFFKIW